MKLSLIVNTAALDPSASNRTNMYRSALYSARAKLLDERILPAAAGFNEVFVVGQFRPGAGYTYVHMNPRYRDRRDALWQRELGARYATGDILVFTHDDHAPGDGFVNKLMGMLDMDWDILCPRRVHGITGEELNNGRAERYMGAHLVVMRRWVWARVPWNALNTEYWDCSLTRMWIEAGARIAWTDDLVHIDCEATENEL